MAAGDAPQLSLDVLQSSSEKYTILAFIGEGSFAKVAKCQVGTTKELVAVKIFKHTKYIKQELYMLSKLSGLNLDNINVIKFYERFDFSGLSCLVFELLATDLYDPSCSPMPVYKIRPIAKQILVALQALKEMKIIHTDIKPDNIMLASIGETPTRAKLIDFGLAIPSFFATYGSIHQPMGYRAPEIILGLPFTEAIDMWGLGCTLAFLYLNSDLFPFECEYLIMQAMVETLGMPSDRQLNHGAYTDRYFLDEEDEHGSWWNLLTSEQYSAINKKPAENRPSWYSHRDSLEDLLNMFAEENSEEMMDRRMFIDFLKEALQLDERERISPDAALQHPFITMSHLSQGSDYLTKAQAFMPTSGPPSRDVVDEDIDEGHSVPLTSSPGQCDNVPEELCPHAAEEDPITQSQQEQWSSEETLDSLSSENGSVVDITTPTPTPTRGSRRLKGVRKFFSRIRKMFFCCLSP